MTSAGIDCFLAVCRYKTVSKAADALYITQSSLSTRLKNLEQELGGELFQRQRGSREMVLTEAGKTFYDLAIQYEEITEKMLQVCRRNQKVLRVSSLNSLGNYLLPEVYDLFMQEYPEIELQIQDMEIESASRSLLAGTTDLAFISGTNSNEHLIQKPVFREQMVLICSSKVDLKPPVSAKALSGLQELYIDWSNLFAQWHRKTIPNDHPQLVVSIMAHLRQFMKNKTCWSIVPQSVAKGLQEDCPIQILETSFTLPDRQISILSKQDNNERTESFIQCLKTALQHHPEIKSVL